MKKYESFHEFERDYNETRDRLCKLGKVTIEQLNNLLTDNDVYLLIIGKTLNFGRDFESSMDNALVHCENMQKARQIFILDAIKPDIEENLF